MKNILFSILVFVIFTTNIATAQNSVVLAEYETRYGDYGKYRGRAANIRLAASLISNVTVQPGETVSFNAVVGRRTLRRGFREAPVILNGRMTKGLGGGVCQVASTLYAAALHSGLDIVEHHHHSRISSYIDPGFDATVDWGSKDLILQNSFDYPIQIIASTRSGTRPAEQYITVQITAPRKTHEVEIRTFSRRIAGFQTVTEIDATLQPGQRQVDEPGTPSMYIVIKRNIRILSSDLVMPTETLEMLYNRSDRRVRIGPAAN